MIFGGLGAEDLAAVSGPVASWVPSLPFPWPHAVLPGGFGTGGAFSAHPLSDDVTTRQCRRNGSDNDDPRLLPSPISQRQRRRRDVDATTTTAPRLRPYPHFATMRGHGDADDDDDDPRPRPRPSPTLQRRRRRRPLALALIHFATTPSLHAPSRSPQTRTRALAHLALIPRDDGQRRRMRRMTDDRRSPHQTTTTTRTT